MSRADTAEGARLQEADHGARWRRWGPHLSERQRSTVREDYSAGGDAWSWSPEHGSGWYVVAANLSAEHSAARALPWPELGGGTARGHHVLALEGAAAGG